MILDQETKLVVEIMQLAYLVQRKTPYCVFIHFSGHVDQLQIDVRESKERWEQEVMASEFYTVYKKWLTDEESGRIAYLQAKKEILQTILETEEIPWEECEVEEKIVRHYTF